MRGILNLLCLVGHPAILGRVIVSIAIFFPGVGVEAGVVVLANRSTKSIHLELRQGDASLYQGILPPGQARAAELNRAGSVRFALSSVGAKRDAAVEVDEAYVFAAGKTNDEIELQKVDLGSVTRDPDVPAARPIRPADSSITGNILRVHVVMDGREPEVEAVWSKRVRKRIEAAAEVLEPVTGFKLEVVRVSSWTPRPTAQNWHEALMDLEERVPLEGERLVIGFTRQYAISPDEFAEGGGLRQLLGTHMLIPEVTPGITADQCLNMLLHELGHFFGAGHAPDTNSPLRPFLSRAPRPWPVSYDPASALIMATVAQEMRSRGVRTFEEVSPHFQRRMISIRERLDEALGVNRLDPNVDPNGAPGDPRGANDLPRAPRRPAANAATGPQVVEISVPDIPGGQAIESGVLRDRAGRLWFGVSSAGIPEPSAHVMCIDLERGQPKDVGAVRARIPPQYAAASDSNASLIRANFVQSPSGDLFFATIGEASLEVDARRAPPGGSHLWRIPAADPDAAWVHIARLPQGVVALQYFNDRLYALTYPDHTVIRVDLADGEVKERVVGCAINHACRTLVMDARGHLYVPRVASPADPSDNSAPASIAAWLVELSPALEPIGETPLNDYLRGEPSVAVGLAGQATLPNGSILTLTSAGILVGIEPPETGSGPAKVAVVERPAIFQQASPWAFRADASAQRIVATVGPPSGGAEPRPTAGIVITRRDGSPSLQHWFAAGSGLPGLELRSATFFEPQDTIILAGRYDRGPLAIPAGAMSTLEARGFTPAQRQRLLENAQRRYQPILFALEPKASSR